MSLKTIVKLSSVNNLSDARYGAGMGVGLMGFNLSSHKEGYISADTFKEISGWISGVQLVAEFTTEGADEITNLLEGYKLDLVQTESVEVATELHSQAVPIILKLSTSDVGVLKSVMEKNVAIVSYFLLEQEEPAIPIAEKTLKELCATYPILIGNNVNEDNIHTLLEEIRPAGIALRGGNEIKPGLKDFDEISQILELLETEE